MNQMLPKSPTFSGSLIKSQCNPKIEILIWIEPYSILLPTLVSQHSPVLSHEDISPINCTVVFLIKEFREIKFVKVIYSKVRTGQLGVSIEKSN